MTKKQILFYSYQLKRYEVWCLGFVLISTVLLQLDPVLHSGVGTPLLVSMAAISWLSPVSGFAYIAASQALPIPFDSAFNPAQIGFYTWLVVTPLRYRRYSLKGGLILLAFLPWLLWFGVVSGQDVYNPQGEYAKSIYYGVIGIQLSNEAKGEYLKCLMGLCVGCLTVSFAYWANQFGLPVTLSTYGGVREGFVRLGGVRADSVMVWPPILMGCFGFLGIVFSVLVSMGKRKLVPKMLLQAALIVVFMSVPCLVATMTNGAVAGFLLMSAFLIVMYIDPKYNRYMSKTNKSLIKKTFMLLLVLVGAMVSLDMFEIQSRILALLGFYELQSNDLGAAASRTDVWEQAIDLMLRFPLVGVLGNGYQNHVQALGAANGSGQFLAHNVFLDYGWQVGFPGLILLTLAFLVPVYLLIKTPKWFPFIGFLCFYFACFIFWMVLSFQFYKTFWSFWALFCVAVYRYSREEGGRSRKATHGRVSVQRSV